jgi:hypothetical protein
VSENNESGNRWEKPAEPDHESTTAAPDVVGAPAAEVPDSVAPAAPSEAPKTSRMPAWMTTRGLVATGAAAAIFLGGGGVGYAVGVHGHHDGNSNFPARFGRNGFGPGGQPPGLGQNQGPQSQSNGSGSGSSSSGSSS